MWLTYQQALGEQLRRRTLTGRRLATCRPINVSKLTKSRRLCQEAASRQTRCAFVKIQIPDFVIRTLPWGTEGSQSYYPVWLPKCFWFALLGVIFGNSQKGEDIRIHWFYVNLWFEQSVQLLESFSYKLLVKAPLKVLFVEIFNLIFLKESCFFSRHIFEKDVNRGDSRLNKI